MRFMTASRDCRAEAGSLRARRACGGAPSGGDRLGLERMGVHAGAEGATGQRGFSGGLAVRRERSRSPRGAGEGECARFQRASSRGLSAQVRGGNAQVRTTAPRPLARAKVLGEANTEAKGGRPVRGLRPE